MLKSFQIRDLHGPQPQESTTGTDNASQTVVDRQALPSQSTYRHGTVQLASSDYDEIASTHPRARLMYMDDDDGEVITVGSSLELSQRLDEAIDAPTRPQMTQRSATTNDDLKPMHIFDIRRSNSVTELWKKFELDSQSPVLQSPEVDGAGQKSENIISPSHDSENAANTEHQHNSASNEPSQPLLASFEAELARLLDSSYISNAGNHGSSVSAEQRQATDSDGQQSSTDSFAQALHHLVNGARSFSSDVRSRMPDFEQQFRDVQRAIPEHVESTLQSVLTTMESRVRTMSDALHNAATARTQRSNNSTPGGVAASTVEGLRTMASELGEMGQTLFETFEAELACNTSADQGQGHGHESSQPEGQTQAGRDNEVSTVGTGPTSSTQQSGPNVPFDDEKESLDQTKVKEEPSDGNARQDAGSSQHTAPMFQNQTPRPGPGPHHRPPVDPPHMAPHPFGGPHPLYFPPHRPHHIIPLHHVPPPPPPPPVPSFQTHPIHNPFWQPRHPHPSPWSRLPHHPPPPPPHPRPWHSGWPPVPRPDFYNQAPTANNLGSSQSRVDQAAKKTLFVGNVGFNVTEKMIKDVFASQGFLVDVHLPLDRQTGKHAGFGYLYFASIHAAKGALEALQGIHIDGHSINLEFSDHSPITDVQGPRGYEQPTPRSDSNTHNADATPVTPELPGPRQLIDDSMKPNQPVEQATKKPASPSPKASNVRTEGSALLDRENEDSDFSARYPSLIPESSRRSSRSNMATPSRLPHLSPKSEMVRFPPVSQLDAHMLANQRRDTELTSDPRAPIGKPRSNGELRARQWSPRASPDRSRSHRIPDHRRHNSRLLRRSNTMMPAHPESRLAGPFDPMAPTETHSATRELRRRATEIHSLLSNPQNNQSAASLENAYRSTPGSFPGDERQHPVLDHNLRYPSTINRIDDCVSTLVGLGYGSAEEGGHQRLAVYAAAADGKVADAIEMIEDERKVYAQQRP